MATRMLKRPESSGTTVSRVDSIGNQPKSESPKAQPTPDTGVGGSSLDTMVAACASELMSARNAFHRLHLKVTGPGSYAAHVAIGDFYDGLPGHADTLVEGYQGAAEKILTLKDVAPRTLDDVADGVAYLREIYGIITKLQGMLPYSEIVNNLDLVKDAINSAKYKLLFLK